MFSWPGRTIDQRPIKKGNTMDESTSKACTRSYNLINQMTLQQQIKIGLFALVGFATFFIGQAIAQLGVTAPYSISRQAISELGMTACGNFIQPQTGLSMYVCSPLHWVFNGSLILHGILTMLATTLAIHPLWPGGLLRKIGLILLFLGGIEAVVAGFSPQNLELVAHMIASGLAIAALDIGLILLGLSALKEQPRIGWFALICGTIGMTGYIMTSKPPYIWLGYGGWERVAGYAFTLWGICMGVYWLLKSKDRKIYLLL